MVVAAYPLLLVLGFVVVPLASLFLPAGSRVVVTSLASLATLLLLFAFMWALVADAEHVREREDTDWNPSRWGYWGLAFVCLFGLFLPVPFVAGYHLYRRYTTVGLPRGRG